MQERHKNRLQYFNEQAKTTEKHVIPYISKYVDVTEQTRVLEIGCGEGGNLQPFLDLGCEAIGVDLSPGKIKLANEFYVEHPNRDKLLLLNQDIYKTTRESIGTFHLIFMRDVIEHIPDQQKFMVFLKQFLKPQGKVFFGFPPWQMPFGGHQQICDSKLLSRLPWFHLLPDPAYKGMLRLFKEDENCIKSLMEIKATGISIERFKKYLKDAGFTIYDETHFLINPNYETKFNLKPRKQIGLIRHIPYVRNFYTTCLYCLAGVD